MSIRSAGLSVLQCIFFRAGTEPRPYISTIGI